MVMIFRIDGTEVEWKIPEGVVALEQNGPDVVLRVNEYAIGVLHADNDGKPVFAISEQVCKDLGIVLRIDQIEP
jgi:hypothetical protein